MGKNISYHSSNSSASSSQTFELPEPDADAVQHSQHLIQLIIEKIWNNNAPISFRDYMEMALYAPGLGYYSAGSTKLGAQGDFITSPEISPLFGQSVARQCDEIFDQNLFSKKTGRQVLEFGAGSGKLCQHIIQSCVEPIRYFILEVSADFRLRQQQLMSEQLTVDQFQQITWLNTLPDQFDGVVIGNELLDAMPVNVVEKNTNWSEMGVCGDENGFEWKSLPERTAAVEAIELIEENLGELPEGYKTEVNLNYYPWFKMLSSISEKLIVLMIDYGYEANTYYDPARHQGTLVCHLQHRAHDDPFVYPGLQDITAFVDFDAVADAAETNGFKTLGLISQRDFLLSNGLLENAESQLGSGDIEQQIKISQAIKTLTLPGEMGDKFKVVAFSKGMSPMLTAFQR